MPCDMTQYPTNWDSEIRPAILQRAGNKCEWCGAENHRAIWYHPSASDYPEVANVWTQDSETAAAWYGGHVMNPHEIIDGYLVVLTIAHIHDPNPMNVDPDNLAALCQTCHNRYDSKMRRMNAIRNKLAELEAAGQLRLF